MALTGNEFWQADGLDPLGHPAGTTQTITSAQVAALYNPTGPTTNPVSVAQGGTGATSVFAAQNNLSLGNYPITNLPIWGAMGDSITANNGDAFSTNFNTGYITWFKALANQSFLFPNALNAGVSGNTLSQMLARVPAHITAMQAAKATGVFFMGGVNDVTAGSSFAIMKPLYESIFNAYLNAGIMVISSTILPVAGLTTSQAQVRVAANIFMTQLGVGRADAVTAAGFAANRSIITVDSSPQLEDFVNGGVLSQYFQDGKHPNSLGALTIGQNYLTQLGAFFLPRNSNLVSHDDYYNATNNTAGNLFSSGTTNYGLLQGTGGSNVPNGGVTPTGSVATGAQVFAGANASTTIANSKENPRTDSPYNSGERQIITFTGPSGGGSLDYCDFRNLAGIGNCVTGDVVVAECMLTVGASPVNAVGMQLGIADGSGSGTDMQVVAQGNPQPLPAYTITLKTPPYTLIAGSPSLTVNLRGFANNTLGATGSSIVYKIANLKVNKQIAY